MEYAADGGVFQHRLKGISVGIPIVYDDGEARVGGDLELALEEGALEVLVHGLPVVIKADLPNGHDLVPPAAVGIADPGAEGRKLLFGIQRSPVGEALGVLGVDAHGGGHVRVLPCLLHGHAAVLQIGAHVDDGAGNGAEIGRGQEGIRARKGSFTG